MGNIISLRDIKKSFNEVKPRCNICGEELSEIDKVADFSIERLLGYGTVYDGEILDMHICCACMERLINSCAIDPVIHKKNEK